MSQISMSIMACQATIYRVHLTRERPGTCLRGSPPFLRTFAHYALGPWFLLRVRTTGPIVVLRRDDEGPFCLRLPHNHSLSTRGARSSVLRGACPRKVA
jgi:hypothetical protein